MVVGEEHKPKVDMEVYGWNNISFLRTAFNTAEADDPNGAWKTAVESFENMRSKTAGEVLLEHIERSLRILVRRRKLEKRVGQGGVLEYKYVPEEDTGSGLGSGPDSDEEPQMVADQGTDSESSSEENSDSGPEPHLQQGYQANMGQPQQFESSPEIQSSPEPIPRESRSSPDRQQQMNRRMNQNRSRSRSRSRLGTLENPSTSRNNTSGEDS